MSIVVASLNGLSSDGTQPNKPFHLTPDSLPSVARTVAGERQG